MILPVIGRFFSQFKPIQDGENLVVSYNLFRLRCLSLDHFSEKRKFSPVRCLTSFPGLSFSLSLERQSRSQSPLAFWSAGGRLLVTGKTRTRLQRTKARFSRCKVSKYFRAPCVVNCYTKLYLVSHSLDLVRNSGDHSHNIRTHLKLPKAAVYPKKMGKERNS